MKTSTRIKWNILILALLPVGAFAVSPTKAVLPDDLKMYYSNKAGLSKTNFKGATEKTIPTNNEYTDNPGCYVSCQSKNSKEGIYHVSDNVYMMGQIRVAGHFMNGLCVPKGYESKDLRRSKEFREQCEKSFPTSCA